MIHLEPIRVINNEIAIGQDIQVNIFGTAAETRVFAIHENLLYAKPIYSWGYNEVIRFFPESPGQYSLLVQWRSQDNKTGWEKYTFNVVTTTFNELTPQRITIDGRVFWVPSKWEALLLSGHEKQGLDFIKKVIKPRWTVYDIGANLGLYSILLSQLVGKDGQVFSIEANPLCVYFLRSNLNVNRVTNCTVLPLAVGKSSTLINFTINYGNNNLGVINTSPFYSTKVGHELLVNCVRFDDLKDSYGLPSPQFIKIDAEGAEVSILEGMTQCLKQLHPQLLIEVHGKEIAAEVVHILTRFDYSFQLLSDRQNTKDAKTMLSRLPEEVTQIFCCI